MKCKDAWLDFAEVFDALRIIPRVVLTAYLFWAGFITLWLIRWYEQLPGVERTGQVTAFITIVLPGIFGLFNWIYKIYSDGARDWSTRGKPAPQSSVDVTASATLTAPAS